MPTVGASMATAFISVSLWAGGRIDLPQECGHFFLDIDDDFGFAQLFGEALIFAAQLFEFCGEGIELGFGAALLWGEGLEVGGVAFAAPVGQQRRVETFAAEEGTDAADTSGLIGFGKNAEFEFGGEASALGLGDDFGIGMGGGRRGDGGKRLLFIHRENPSRPAV